MSLAKEKCREKLSDSILIRVLTTSRFANLLRTIPGLLEGLYFVPLFPLVVMDDVFLTLKSEVLASVSWVDNAQAIH